ncbi:flavodoxin [Fusobacterium russii]|uniref:flavodoxin n=1 Tax=Fusobacterium russii TaxID=854 RepID=UPI0003AABDDF|nr:flavodoxin [Fusobacterium russii]
MEKILIAYFSWSGNSEYIANLLKSELKADIFHIQADKKYSNSYAVAVAQVAKEKLSKEKIQLLNKLENINDYNKIILIYPAWWFTCPNVVLSFLETFDSKGKTIIPICNHNGGGLGKSIEDIKKTCPDAEIKSGFAIKKPDVKKTETFSAVLEYIQA